MNKPITNEEVEHFMRLYLEGKDPLYEMGKERAKALIREGHTEPQWAAVANPYSPAYMRGYIDVFKSLGYI